MSCSDCQHLCRRKLAGSCMTTNNGGRTVNTQHIDTERMRQTGVIQGPYKRTHPITISWSAVIGRALLGWWDRVVMSWWYAHIIDRQVHD